MQRCARALRGLEFAEIRLDQLAQDPAQVGPLFAASPATIATCRPGRFDEPTRKRLLLQAIEAGASFVDVEIESAPAYRRALVAAAKRHGCEVIISFHDFAGTPSRKVLEGIIRRSFAMGADVAKVACTVNSPLDSARLLGLLDSHRRLVVLGMGEAGKGTRLLAPLLGSEFTFAARYRSRQTAPGQPDPKTARLALRQLQKMGF